MMSRITISLKSSVEDMKNVNVVRPLLPSAPTQQSHLDIASNIEIVIKQTRSVDSSPDFVELSTMDLKRNQSNPGVDNRKAEPNKAGTTIRKSRRGRLSPIQQESSDWECDDVDLSTRSREPEFGV